MTGRCLKIIQITTFVIPIPLWIDVIYGYPFGNFIMHAYTCGLKANGSIQKMHQSQQEILRRHTASGQKFPNDLHFMIWFRGTLTQKKIALKVLAGSWALASQKILNRSFKWGIIWLSMCNFRKVAGCQSWRSKRSWDILGSRLHFSWPYIVNRCSSSDPGSNPGGRKLWKPTVLQPLGLQG